MTVQEWRDKQERSALVCTGERGGWIAGYGYMGLMFPKMPNAYWTDADAIRLRDWLIELFPVGTAEGRDG